MGFSWKALRISCDNEACTGEFNPKTNESNPFRLKYIGRRFWAHGFKCPGCGRVIWLQREPWTRSEYDRSPIQEWDFWAFLFVIAFLAIPVGIVIHYFNGGIGFTVLVIVETAAFVGGVALVRKDMTEVDRGDREYYDKRLLFPLFVTGILFPFLFFLLDPEELVKWGILGSVVGGYVIGSVLEALGY